MMQKSKKLGDLFPLLGLLDPCEEYRNIEILKIAPVEGAIAGDLIFVAQESFFRNLPEICPSAAIVSDSLFAALPKDLSYPVLRSQDAKLACAKVSKLFCSDMILESKIHLTAVIHVTAKIAADAAIGPNVVVDAHSEVGAGSQLHAGVFVGPRVKIGAQTTLFPGVKIYQDTLIGARVRIHANTVIGADGFGYTPEKKNGRVEHVKIHHIGRVRIDDDVEIGANSSIDRATMGETIIERGCIIDNHVQIGHNCKIEEGAIICGCTGLSGSVRVGKYALIAGMCGISNQVEIGTGARVSGMSGVPKNIPAGTDWGGNPARPMRDYFRLQVLFGRLPELFEERRKARKGEKQS